VVDCVGRPVEQTPRRAARYIRTGWRLACRPVYLHPTSATRGHACPACNVAHKAFVYIGPENLICHHGTLQPAMPCILPLPHNMLHHSVYKQAWLMAAIHSSNSMPWPGSHLSFARTAASLSRSRASASVSIKSWAGGCPEGRPWPRNAGAGGGGRAISAGVLRYMDKPIQNRHGRRKEPNGLAYNCVAKQRKLYYKAASPKCGKTKEALL
jgi:hypothetical protein